jgi:hypothetical protein
MSKHVLRWLAAFALAAIVGVPVVGCWNPFAPEGGGDTPPVVVQYKPRTSPANVVYNLNTAYKWMNADEYLACLAEDFVFTLNPDDVNDPENPLPETWGKQEERDIHERMFADTTNVDRISLTLTNISIDFDQGEDPYSQDDDRYTHVEGTDLRVVVGDWTFLANADQEFVFQIDPDETGQDGEILWEIVEWTDKKMPTLKVGSDGVGEAVQPLSFGRFKAMYR